MTGKVVSGLVNSLMTNKVVSGPVRVMETTKNLIIIFSEICRYYNLVKHQRINL